MTVSLISNYHSHTRRLQAKLHTLYESLREIEEEIEGVKNWIAATKCNCRYFEYFEMRNRLEGLQVAQIKVR